MPSLESKIILITGAARGIGAACVKYCLDKGATVLANCRTEDAAEKLKQSLAESEVSRLQVLLYDVTDSDSIKRQFRLIQSQYSRLDGLVNNAGFMLEQPIPMTRKQDLEGLFATNVNAAFEHIQLASRLMIRQKGGSIVNLGSVVGEQGARGQAAYAMSKASLSALAKSAAKEFGASGIRVNTIAPGFIETDLTAHYSEQQKSELLAHIATNRFGKAHDVAKAIGFLLSDDAEYISGQVIGVDGALALP